MMQAPELMWRTMSIPFRLVEARMTELRSLCQKCHRVLRVYVRPDLSGLLRGGAVYLNKSRGFPEWLSASVTLLPTLAPMCFTASDSAISRQVMRGATAVVQLEDRTHTGPRSARCSTLVILGPADGFTFTR